MLSTLLALFSCKKTPAANYANDWSPYMCKVNNMVASVFVDLGVKAIAPDKNKPELLWVWVSMNSVREDGLPKDNEFEAQNKIEDILESEITKKLKAIYVGRVTTSGRREYYFFGPSDNNFENTVKAIMHKFPNNKYQFGSKSDPNWSQYFEFLYPTPQQYQCIQNMKVVEQLRKAGDKLEKARNVSHWAYFKDDKTREIFIQKTTKLGFTPNNEYKTFKSGEKYPYGIMIEKVDKVDPNSIDEVVINIWQIARDLGGDYDGWETSVEK